MWVKEERRKEEGEAEREKITAKCVNEVRLKNGYPMQAFKLQTLCFFTNINTINVQYLSTAVDPSVVLNASPTNAARS